MTAPSNHVLPATGAVLVGGRSSRMGISKHAIKLSDGRTMLDHVADSLQRVCPRIVTCGQSEPDPGQARGYVQIPDLRPGLGPLGGLEALLSSNLDDHYLVVPCDTPLLTAELLQRLLQPTPAIASVLQVEGNDEFEPLPLRISAPALPVIRRLLGQGRRGVHQLVAAVPRHVVEITHIEARQLANINTREDLEALRPS